MSDLRAFLTDDAIPALEQILDYEDIDHESCAAISSYPFCGSAWCQDIGCVVDKLARARALAEQEITTGSEAA